MEEIISRIKNIGIVPVVALENLEDSKPLARALFNGGIPVAEVTFRTDVAYEVMLSMKEEVPEMIIGAGTVLTKAQVDKAIEAKAEFIVTPGFNPEIVEYCLEKGVPIVPGISNASEIEKALSFGLKVVKFFPAEQLGGINMIKALNGPYKDVKFMPTGGINEKNLNTYLSNPNVLACGGTWMVDKKALKEKKYGVIEELSKKAIKNMLNINIKHVGVNAEDINETAKDFSRLLQGEIITGDKGYFIEDKVEVVSKEYYKGANGHIAIGVNNCDRARRYYEALGYEFDEETIKYDKNGNLERIYFKEEISGFAVHLCNN